MLLIDGKETKVISLWGKDGFIKKEALPGIFKLHSGLKRKTFNKRTGKTRIHSPRSTGIEMFYTVTTKNGETIEIRYAKGTRVVKTGGVGEKIYYPEYTTIPDSGYITVNDFDLYFFLAHHPRNQKSPFRNIKKNPIFYLENKAAEASLRADKSRDKIRAQALLYGEKDGLSEKDFAMVARSYRIPNTDSMTPDQIRVELEKHANSDPSKFIQSTAGNNVKVKALIQAAIDLELIMFDSRIKSWSTVTGQGTAKKPGEFICEVRFANDKEDRLAIHITEKDGKMLSALEEMVEERSKELELDQVGEDL